MFLCRKKSRKVFNKLNEKKKIKIAIDSPAGSGAGTQAKLISKKYNLLYLDTGKLYRILGYHYLKEQ